MARNGSGTYSRVTGTPYVYNTTIDQVVVNAEMNDIATALTNSLAKDGQTTPTANLPMGGYKLTGLAAGSGNGESVRYEQLIATSIVNTPTGSIAATNVQTALNELDTEKAALSGATFTGPVLFDTVADIASAATIDLTAYGSGFIATVTGTTPTTTFVMSDGQFGTLAAAGAWPLTYHATTNKVVSGLGHTCYAGQLVDVRCTGGVIYTLPHGVEYKPAFLAIASAQANVTGDGTSYTVLFDTEIFDNAGNLASSVFTAPIAGKYRFSVTTSAAGLAVGHTTRDSILATSNRNYRCGYAVSSVATTETFSASHLVDMDAGDTAYVVLNVSGSTKVVDINIFSTFSGELVC